MSPTAATPNHATLREFCDAQGWKPSYGHQLKREGRLVLHTDGKTVLVAESVARIAATRDPSKQGVADMHAATRAKSPKAATVKESLSVEAPEPPADGADTDQAGVQLYDFQNSKAKREHFAALEAEASYRARVGELLEASEVKAVLSETLTTLRVTMEGLANRLTPALAAEVDEAQISAMLTTEIRHALTSAADELAKLGR